jgi:hypothetical protein
MPAGPRPRLIFPGKLNWEQRTAPSPTFTLAIAFALVGQFQATALRVFLQATGHSPRAIRPALGPADPRGPYGFSALAAGKWQIRAVRVIAPRRWLSVEGSGRAGRHQNADKQEAKQDSCSFHESIRRGGHTIAPAGALRHRPRRKFYPEAEPLRNGQVTPTMDRRRRVSHDHPDAIP